MVRRLLFSWGRVCRGFGDVLLVVARNNVTCAGGTHQDGRAASSLEGEGELLTSNHRVFLAWLGLSSVLEVLRALHLQLGNEKGRSLSYGGLPLTTHGVPSYRGLIEPKSLQDRLKVMKELGNGAFGRIYQLQTACGTGNHFVSMKYEASARAVRQGRQWLMISLAISKG